MDKLNYEIEVDTSKENQTEEEKKETNHFFMDDNGNLLATINGFEY